MSIENSSEEAISNIPAGSADDKTSRRQFLAGAVPSAALAVGAGMLRTTGASAAASTESAALPIRIPAEVTASLAQAPQTPSFEDKGGKTGAEVFAKLCKDENLAAMFCAPGNYAVIHSLAAIGIPSYGGRTEGAMCCAADGFYRVSGEVTACSGTEGPGFTHMIQGIANAHAANTPLLVLASNLSLAVEDSYASIQMLMQQPLTQGIKKYGKRITAPDRVYEYGSYAFRELKSGVPGPVHLDFPAEVAFARFTNSDKLTDYYEKTRYRTESRAAPSSQDLNAAVALIRKSERPLLVAGHGVFHRKAWDTLQRLVEQHEMAAVCTGPMRGHFPDDHRLSMALSPSALMSADLVIFVGQYCMPTRSDWRFNPDIKAISVSPEAEQLGRNWPLDLGIVADEAEFLEALMDKLPPVKRDAWAGEIAAARKKFEGEQAEYYKLGLKYSKDTGVVHPAIIAKELHDFLYRGTIDPKQTVVGWGGMTCSKFVPQMLRSNRPGQGMACLYQFGAMGPELSMTIGAAVAVKNGAGAQAAYKGAPVFNMTTDSGAAYSIFEMATAAKYKIPVIALVYNNNTWGTWATAENSARSVHLHLHLENQRYDKVAEGLGCRGEHVTTPEQLREALKRSYEIAARESLPTVINVAAIKEFTSGKLYPPGFTFPAEPGIGGFGH
jgi:acetolactate synthase I/II/III large subunit